MYIVDDLGEQRSGIATIVSLLFYIPAFWFLIAQGAKRCHDRGHTGICQIIPFYNWWLIFAIGEIGRNNYGVNPKGLKYEITTF